MPRLSAMACVLEEVDRLSSILFSPLFHPLLVLANCNGVWIKRDQNYFSRSFRFSSFFRDARIRRPQAVVFA
jgi:hypothetical protein